MFEMPCIDLNRSVGSFFLLVLLYWCHVCHELTAVELKFTYSDRSTGRRNLYSLFLAYFLTHWLFHLFCSWHGYKCELMSTAAAFSLQIPIYMSTTTTMIVFQMDICPFQMYESWNRHIQTSNILGQSKPSQMECQSTTTLPVFILVLFSI